MKQMTTAALKIAEHQSDFLANVPIIALTANVAGGARDMLLREGMSDFIGKPISLRTITSKIRRWLPAT